MKTTFIAALAVCGVCLSFFVVWLYGTYEPSEKTYSFDYDYSLFDFRAGHSVVLPRSFDKLSLRRHEALQQIRKEEEKELERYESAPMLGSTDSIYTVIKKWADFYGLDLSQARDMSGEILFCFSCPDSQLGNPYNRAFTPQDDSADRIEMFYSPDRKRYIDVGIIYKTENDRRVRDIDAYETIGQMYLIDRTLKQTKVLFNLNGEVVFWLDNDSFILAGYVYDNSYNYYSVSLLDIGNETAHHYRLRMDEPVKKSYHNTVVLKEMGIELF